MRRQYISIDHYQAPFRGAVLQGLGTTRQYYELSQFRSPYRHGYFQDNSLMGTPVGASETELANLQSALGVKQSGVFDGATQAGIRSQQAKHNLPVTGVPDAALLAALGLFDPARLPPASSSWRRDLNTGLSQVPPFGYGLLSIALFGAAYIGYRRWKKKRGGVAA